MIQLPINALLVLGAAILDRNTQNRYTWKKAVSHILLFSAIPGGPLFFLLYRIFGSKDNAVKPVRAPQRSAPSISRKDWDLYVKTCRDLPGRIAQVKNDDEAKLLVNNILSVQADLQKRTDLIITIPTRNEHVNLALKNRFSTALNQTCGRQAEPDLHSARVALKVMDPEIRNQLLLPHDISRIPITDLQQWVHLGAFHNPMEDGKTILHALSEKHACSSEDVRPIVQDLAADPDNFKILFNSKYKISTGNWSPPIQRTALWDAAQRRESLPIFDVLIDYIPEGNYVEDYECNDINILGLVLKFASIDTLEEFIKKILPKSRDPQYQEKAIHRLLYDWEEYPLDDTKIKKIRLLMGILQFTVDEAKYPKIYLALKKEM